MPPAARIDCMNWIVTLEHYLGIKVCGCKWRTVYVPWRFAFNSTFKLFHPPHAALKQTELPICFSTGHDIRAARFNAARRYSRARTRWALLPLSARSTLHTVIKITEFPFALWTINLYVGSPVTISNRRMNNHEERLWIFRYLRIRKFYFNRIKLKKSRTQTRQDERKDTCGDKAGQRPRPSHKLSLSFPLVHVTGITTLGSDQSGVCSAIVAFGSRLCATLRWTEASTYRTSMCLEPSTMINCQNRWSASGASHSYEIDDG